jgi:hypothetical protein
VPGVSFTCTNPAQCSGLYSNSSKRPAPFPSTVHCCPAPPRPVTWAFAWFVRACRRGYSGCLSSQAGSLSSAALLSGEKGLDSCCQGPGGPRRGEATWPAARLQYFSCVNWLQCPPVLKTREQHGRGHNSRECGVPASVFLRLHLPRRSYLVLSRAPRLPQPRQRLLSPR